MITNNGEPKPNPLGTDAHDGQFEGSCLAYAEHLQKDHGFTEEQVLPHKFGMTEGDWIVLDKLHRAARSLNS